MFNLGKAIAEWREETLAAGIGTPVPLDELENHLREDVKNQIQSGGPTNAVTLRSNPDSPHRLPLALCD